METTMKAHKAVPQWLQWFVDLTWYEWLAWIAEAVLVVTFVWITADQFAENLSRAGWIMVLLTILTCGPGLWLILGYRPAPGEKFGKYDIGAIICFAIWAIMLAYLLIWTVDFQPGFGHRFE